MTHDFHVHQTLTVMSVVNEDLSFFFQFEIADSYRLCDLLSADVDLILYVECRANSYCRQANNFVWTNGDGMRYRLE